MWSGYAGRPATIWSFVFGQAHIDIEYSKYYRLSGIGCATEIPLYKPLGYEPNMVGAHGPTERTIDD